MGDDSASGEKSGGAYRYKPPGGTSVNAPRFQSLSSESNGGFSRFQSNASGVSGASAGGSSGRWGALSGETQPFSERKPPPVKNSRWNEFEPSESEPKMETGNWGGFSNSGLSSESNFSARPGRFAPSEDFSRDPPTFESRGGPGLDTRDAPVDDPGRPRLKLFSKGEAPEEVVQKSSSGDGLSALDRAVMAQKSMPRSEGFGGRSYDNQGYGGRNSGGYGGRDFPGGGRAGVNFASFGSERERGKERERKEQQLNAPKLTSRLATLDIGHKLQKQSIQKILSSTNEPKKKTKKISSAKKLSETEVSAILFRVIKDFFSLLQKNTALKAIENQLTGQEFEVELFSELFAKSKKLEIREKKTVLGLIVSLEEKNLLSKEDISQAINHLAKKLIAKLGEENLSPEKEAVSKFEEHFKFFEEAGLFSGVEFSDDVKKIVTPLSDILSRSKELIDIIASSEQKGQTLVDCYLNYLKEVGVTDEGVLKYNITEGSVIAIQLFERIVSSNIDFITTDSEVSWLEESEYGAILSFMVSLEKHETASIQKDDVESLLKTQTEFIHILQLQFFQHKSCFSRTTDGESIFELCLMKLYEFCEDDAFFYWKDNKYRIITQLSTEEQESKEQALVECAQFLDFLEEHEEEEENEE